MLYPAELPAHSGDRGYSNLDFVSPGSFLRTLSPRADFLCIWADFPLFEFEPRRAAACLVS